jgi:hypothetical protein
MYPSFRTDNAERYFKPLLLFEYHAKNMSLLFALTMNCSCPFRKGHMIETIQASAGKISDSILTAARPVWRLDSSGPASTVARPGPAGTAARVPVTAMIKSESGPGPGLSHLAWSQSESR